MLITIEAGLWAQRGFILLFLLILLMFGIFQTSAHACTRAHTHTHTKCSNATSWLKTLTASNADSTVYRQNSFMRTHIPV